MTRRGRHARRSGRAPFLLIAAAILIGGAGFLAAKHLSEDAAAGERRAGRRETPAVTASSVRAPAKQGEIRDPQVPFAEAAGVQLMLPAKSPVLVAYHEASYGYALELTPHGTLDRDFNRTKFDKPVPTPGPRYVIEASRGRRTPATSAVDVVMKRGTEVTSPVTGTVVKAHPYKLYGRYRDWYVAIAPEGYTDVQVVMIHLDHVRVRRGDEVSATLSAIGEPRVFPFRSEVNYYVAGGDPHVHIEVKDLAEAKRP